MRSDVDLFLRHDECAIKQGEITDRTLALLTDRKRAAGITRNMFSDKDGTGFCAVKFPEDLCALAIKAFAELDVWWDRIRPPVPIDMSILFDVTHERNFPDVYSFA